MKHLRPRRNSIDVTWPNPPFQVALVEPEIPPNTGNIARVCAATGSILNLIGVLGFHITDREVRRAGLDYWDSVQLRRHDDFEVFAAPLDSDRIFLFSTKGERPYTSVDYRPGDALVFGCESKGLPDEILDTYAERVVSIPLDPNAVRSLNLSSSVAIVLYEALRQTGAW